MSTPKIATLDTKALLERLLNSQEVAAVLAGEFASREAELRSKKEGCDQLHARILEATDSQREELVCEADLLCGEFETLQLRFNRDLEARQREFVNAANTAIQTAVSAYAVAHQIDIVFPANQPFSSPALNITDDVFPLLAEVVLTQDIRHHVQAEAGIQAA